MDDRVRPTFCDVTRTCPIAFLLLRFLSLSISSLAPFFDRFISRPSFLFFSIGRYTPQQQSLRKSGRRQNNKKKRKEEWNLIERAGDIEMIVEWRGEEGPASNTIKGSIQ
jgi:hypothetical protein